MIWHVRRNQLQIKNLATGFFQWRIAVAILVSVSMRAEAQEAIGYVGSINRDSASGCCFSYSPAPGYGVSVRTQNVGKLGPLEFGGFSDFKWSEAYLARVVFLTGGLTQTDPKSNSELTIAYVPNWSVALSYGLGVYSHATRTVLYERAAIVVGVQPLLRMTVSWNLSDVYFLALTGSGGVGISSLETTLNSGLGIGIGYRF